MTEDYLHVIPNPTYLLSGNTREIEIVTEAEFAHYVSSGSMSPDTIWPIAKIVGTTLYANPITSVNISFSYFKKPSSPYYDYYVNANDEQVYLVPATSHTLLAGEEYLDKDDMLTVRTAGYNITAGINKSVELPFPENERIDVAYNILQKMGMPISKFDVAQYGMIREQKEETL